MTDKQIIIDGIDVSKCIYFQQEDGEYTCGAEECNGAIVACRACDNCYYKQLKLSEQRIVELNKTIKAKEQECEELRKKLIKCDDNIIVDCEYSKKDLCSFIHRKKEVINGLQQQLDQLKAENKELKKISCKFKDYCTCDTEKLKQTLTEIKVLSENVYCLTNALNRDMALFAKEIIQKISECEENDA